ncbi:hypothetical protein CK203_087122 [Vitis vinifera]|uniref:Uncharacterized protein n=1 Tax=Vitis vinifera TaxID=29760 RepID=A0A438D8X2_VITVI|nr:hypothetical protein CK203_087122 [Vitis vinifera]
MATFFLRLPLSLTVALMCMAMAATVSAAPTHRSEEGEASMMKKLQGDGRNIDPTFAAEKLHFYVLSKGQTPPSGPSKRHNRRLQFTGGQTRFHALANQQTVPPSHDPSKRDNSTPSEFTRGKLDFQALSKGQTVPHPAQAKSTTKKSPVKKLTLRSFILNYYSGTRYINLKASPCDMSTSVGIPFDYGPVTLANDYLFGEVSIQYSWHVAHVLRTAKHCGTVSVGAELGFAAIGSHGAILAI